MHKLKKILLLFLVCVMSMTIIPMEVFAATNSIGVSFSAFSDTRTIETAQTAQKVVVHVVANKKFPIDAIGMTAIIPTGWSVASIENADLVFPAANINLANGKVNYATPDAENWTTSIVASVTYNVPANVAPGTYELGIRSLTISKDYGTEWESDGFASAWLTVMGKTSVCTVYFYSNGGSGVLSSVSVPRGSTYTLPACTFTPPSGRQFRAWSVNGIEKYPGETIVVQSDITISAIWQDIPGTPVTQIYSVTAQAGAGGSISPAGISNVLQYSDIAYTITPESGYEISDVIVDGANIGLTASYTFERVTTNHSITAVFEKKETPPAVPIYTDVLSSAWYYGDVQFVTERGLMNGVGEGLFAPDTLTDRAMIVTVLWRMEGSPIQKTSADFFDVSDGMWYTDAVRWASANGIVNGYGNSLFGPTDKITREQVMAILHRYVAYKGKTDGTILPMLEAYTYSPWAEGDVFWAENNGLLNNMGIRVNNMTEKASRGEIAAYLHRFCLLLDES